MISLTQSTELGTIYSIKELKAIKKMAEDFDYRCKQAGQLASKMKFISTQWITLLEDELWKKNASHANNMAKYFEKEVLKIESIEIKFPVESNSVFINAPEKVMTKLRKKDWIFYNFIGLGGGRFVFSWNSTKQRIDKLIKNIKDSF